MAQKASATINTELANWLSEELNTKVSNTKLLYPDNLNAVLTALYSSIKDINDSAYNKVDSISITNVAGLTAALAGKEAADPTILKQSSIVNNVTSTSTTAPLSAAQGKLLKDLIDGIHAQNTDTVLDQGGDNEVTAEAIRTHINQSNIHFTQSQIDHNNILNRGINSHSQIDSHIADTNLHFTKQSISHNDISDIGSNSHAAIDAHIASTSNPHSTTFNQTITAELISKTKGTILVSNGSAYTAVAPGSNGQVLKFDSNQPSGVIWAEESGEANTLGSLGTGVSLVGPKAGTELKIKSINSTDSKLNISADTENVNFTLNESSIEHDNLLGTGSNTHLQIDNHISSTANPHQVTATQTLSQEGFIFTKGRIYVSDGTKLSSLPVDSDGKVLTTNSATVTGLEWTTPIGEANTASNISGSGVSVFDSKSGVDLRFRKIDAADSKVTVALNGSKIDVGIVPSNISHQSLSGVGVNTHEDIDNHIANLSNPHSVTKAQIGLSNVNNLKQNLSAVAAPTANDDSGSGYSVGSTWYDTVNKRAYVCLDASSASAVWKPTSFTEQTALTTALSNLTQSGSFTPDYTIQAFTNSSPFGFATADEAETVLSVIINLQTRVNELENKLQAANVIG